MRTSPIVLLRKIPFRAPKSIPEEPYFTFSQVIVQWLSPTGSSFSLPE